MAICLRATSFVLLLLVLAAHASAEARGTRSKFSRRGSGGSLFSKAEHSSKKAEEKEEKPSSRTKRLFSLFSVVTFPVSQFTRPSFSQLFSLKISRSSNGLETVDPRILRR